MTITRQDANIEHIIPHFLSLLDDKTYARLTEVVIPLNNVYNIDDILDAYKNTMISNMQLIRNKIGGSGASKKIANAMLNIN